MKKTILDTAIVSLFIIGVLMVSGCDILTGIFDDNFAAKEQADFYQHEDGRLLICKPGTAPSTPGWRSVGDGQTTLEVVDCSDL